jgi:hypothetical protein
MIHSVVNTPGDHTFDLILRYWGCSKGGPDVELNARALRTLIAPAGEDLANDSWSLSSSSSRYLEEFYTAIMEMGSMPPSDIANPVKRAMFLVSLLRQKFRTVVGPVTAVLALLRTVIAAATTPAAYRLELPTVLCLSPDFWFEAVGAATRRPAPSASLEAGEKAEALHSVLAIFGRLLHLAPEENHVRTRLLENAIKAKLFTALEANAKALVATESGRGAYGITANARCNAYLRGRRGRPIARLHTRHSNSDVLDDRP